MKGYVVKTIYNKGWPFGFIQGDDGQSYYFDMDSLPDGIGMSTFYVNDYVEFDTKRTSKGLSAVNVMYISDPNPASSSSQNKDISEKQLPGNQVPKQTSPSSLDDSSQFYRPGFAKNFDHYRMKQYLKPESGELEVINKLSELFYISHANRHNMGHQNFFPFFLLGATEFTKQFIRDKSEFLLVFSHFKRADWQQNTLKVASYIRQRKEIADRRPRVNFYILVSNANTLKDEIDKIKGGTEAAVIPFTFNEILKSNSGSLRSLIISRFDEYYFENNMFGEEKPIEEESLLFGDRGKIADTIVQRTMDGSHSGIFGLRRSGKSSVLRAVMRRLQYNQIKYIHIESQSFLESLDSWKTALYDIAREIRKTTLGLERRDDETRAEYTERLKLLSSEADYEKRAAQCFVDDVKNYTKGTTFVIAIDEIELITYNTANSSTWCDLDAYKNFWGALRDSCCTLIVCGVNSTINESSHISFKGKECDNPMYERIHLCADFSKNYLPAFTDEQTKYMINQLGSYSNIAFNNVFTEINNAFGGQPYPIRQFCAFVFERVKKQRKHHELYEVSKPNFEVLHDEFCQSEKGYQLCKTILQHIAIYKPEYDLLCDLALSPEKHRTLSPDTTTPIDHLEKYGIIEYDRRTSHAAFKIHALQDYIVRTQNKSPRSMDNDERREHIQHAVAECEKKLKTQILRYYITNGLQQDGKNLLLGTNPTTGKPYVIKTKNCPDTFVFKDLFDHSRFIMYFSTLRDIFYNNWSTLGKSFQNFGISKEKFYLLMNALNAGRTDADHYDAEDLTLPDEWEIDDLTIDTFTTAYNTMREYFEENLL